MMGHKDKSKEELIEEIERLNKRIVAIEGKDQILLQKIIDLLPIRIFWKDKDLRYLGCNQIFAMDAGKNSRDEVIGRDDFQMGWKEQADKYRDDDKRVIESGQEKLDFEEAQTTPKGDKIWLKTSKVILTDAAGEKIGILGTYEDITRRKLVENSLRESESRFKDLTWSIGDWVWEVDEKGVYTYVSDKGLEILGWSREEIIGKTPFDFMLPEEVKRVGAIFSEIAAKKAPIKDLENWNLTKDGKKICLLTNGVPILDQNGVLKGYRGVDKNITEFKKLQEEERSHTKTLQTFYNGAIGREERILDLKKEVAALKKELGRP